MMRDHDEEDNGATTNDDEVRRSFVGGECEDRRRFGVCHLT